MAARLKLRKVVLLMKVLKAWKGFRHKLESLSGISLGSTVSSFLGATTPQGALAPPFPGYANSQASTTSTSSEESSSGYASHALPFYKALFAITVLVQNINYSESKYFGFEWLFAAIFKMSLSSVLEGVCTVYVVQ